MKIDLFENQRAFDKLEEFGYIKVGYQREGDSIIEIKSTPQIEKIKGNKVFIKNAKFIENKDKFYADHLSVQIKLSSFAEKFQECAKNTFPDLEDVVFETVGQEVRVLYKFRSASSPEAIIESENKNSSTELVHSHQGVAGLKIKFVNDGNSFSFFTTDRFFVGKGHHAIISSTLFFLASALGLEKEYREAIANERDVSTSEWSFDVRHLESVLKADAHLGVVIGSRVSFPEKSECFCLASVADDCLELKIDTNVEQVVKNTEVMPIDILESREMKALTHEIDLKVTQGIYPGEGAFPNVESSPIWARKMVECCPEISLDGISKAKDCLEKFGQNDLVFNSLKVEFCRLKHQNEDYLKEVSHIFDRVHEIFGAHDLFKSVFAEGLTYGWKYADYDNCQRALKLWLSCDDDFNPIYLEAIHLCDRFEKFENKRDFLEQWLAKPIDKNTRKFVMRILMRLLNDKLDDRQGADKVAEELLAIDPGSKAALEQLLDSLLEKGQREQAIQLMTRGIDYLTRKQELSRAADLEVRVADIWRSMKRYDIAEQRIQSALSKDPENKAANERLEGVLRQLDTSEKLEDFMLERIDFALQNKNHELVREWRTKLHQQHKLDGAYDSILQLELKVLKAQMYETDWVLEIKDLAASPAVWKEFVDLLESQVDGDESRSFNGPQINALISILGNKVGDMDREAEYLEKQIKRMGFDKSSLDKVEANYTKRKKYDALLAVYRDCIEKIDDDTERQAIMNKMLAIPTKLSDSDRNTISLSLLKMDETNDIPVKKRISQLVDSGKWDEVREVSEKGLDIVTFHFKKIKWIRDIISILEDVESTDKLPVQEWLYQNLLTLEDDTAVATEVLVAFDHKASPTVVSRATQKLLELGVLPSITDSAVEEILAEEYKLLAVFYELKGMTSSDPFEKANYYRKAYESYKDVPGEGVKSELCLQHMLERGYYPELFSEYRDLSVKNSNLQTYVNTLLAMAKTGHAQHLKEDDFEAAIQYLKAHKNLVSRLMEVCRVYMDVLGFTSEIVTLYLGCLDSVGDSSSEIQFIKNQLSKKNLGKYVKESLLLERLKQLGESEFLKGYVSRRISEIKDDESLSEFIEIGFDHGILEPNIKARSFEIGLRSNNKRLIEMAWYSMIQDLSGVTAAKEFYEHSKSAILELGYEALWMKLISSLPDKVDVDAMDLSSFKEVCGEAGLELLESDSFLDVSEKLLANVYKVDPKESKVWIPLYMVMRKNENSEGLVELLSFIIPQVSRNLTLLKNYPVTVESLENELSQLSSGNYKMAVGAEYTPPIDFQGGGTMSHSIEDWREVVLKRNVRKGMTSKYNSKAFASALEKHVALQTITLLSGEVDQLKSLKAQVWRDASAYDYPLDGRGRYPSGFSSEAIGSPLHRLVTRCIPSIVSAYKNRFSIHHIANKIGVDPGQIIHNRNPLRWDESYLPTVGFDFYKEKLDKHRYVVFDLPGLKSEIFFDGSQRSFYFDAHYCKAQPPTHLFHKILFIVWGLKFNYYVPMTLDVRTELLPYFDELYRRVEKGIFSDLKNKLMGPTNAFDVAFQKLDLDSIRPLMEQIGKIDPGSLYALKNAMYDHVARLQLSETLDLVGIIEALAGVDLINHSEMKLYEIFDSHDAIENLITFACNLKL